MKISEKYKEALKSLDEFVTVSAWAVKFSQMFPNDFEKEFSGDLKLLTSKLSSKISSGKFCDWILIDSSEKPRLVKYLTKEEYENKIKTNKEEDVEPLRRQDIIRAAKDSLEAKELYRITEFENIRKGFKEFFNIDFEIVPMQILLTDDKVEEFNPSNLQFLLKYHVNKKDNNSWQRFTVDEQIEYIKRVIDLQNTLIDRLEIEINNSVFDSLITRLVAVY